MGLLNHKTGRDYDTSPTGLEQLPHATLYAMRDGQGKDAQNLLAPYEHRAFAREAIPEHPWLAPSVFAGAALYDIAKVLGYGDARSDPSFESFKQGLLGAREGWAAANPQARPTGFLGDLLRK